MRSSSFSLWRHPNSSSPLANEGRRNSGVCCLMRPGMSRGSPPARRPEGHSGGRNLPLHSLGYHSDVDLNKIVYGYDLRLLPGANGPASWKESCRYHSVTGIRAVSYKRGAPVVTRVRPPSFTGLNWARISGLEPLNSTEGTEEGGSIPPTKWSRECQRMNRILLAHHFVADLHTVPLEMKI